MRDTLTALLGRITSRFEGSDTADASANSAEQPRQAPDLFECDSCGTVMISEPRRCPSCDGTTFTNAGKFDG